MRISHFFIDRPIFAAVVSVVFVILGAVSFGRLPVAQYPEIAPPVINVTGQYPGASAEVVASTVVAPLSARSRTRGILASGATTGRLIGARARWPPATPTRRERPGGEREPTGGARAARRSARRSRPCSRWPGKTATSTSTSH